MKIVYLRNLIVSVWLLTVAAVFIFGCILVAEIYQPSLLWLLGIIPAVVYIWIVMAADCFIHAKARRYAFLMMATLLSGVLLGTWALCLLHHSLGIVFMFAGAFWVSLVTVPFVRRIFNTNLPCWGLTSKAKESVFIMTVLLMLFGGVGFYGYETGQTKNALLRDMHYQEPFIVEEITKTTEKGKEYYSVRLRQGVREVKENFPLKCKECQGVSDVKDLKKGDKIRYVWFKPGWLIGFEILQE